MTIYNVYFRGLPRKCTKTENDTKPETNTYDHVVENAPTKFKISGNARETKEPIGSYDNPTKSPTNETALYHNVMFTGIRPQPCLRAETNMARFDWMLFTDKYFRLNQTRP